MDMGPRPAESVAIMRLQCNHPSRPLVGAELALGNCLVTVSRTTRIGADSVTILSERVAIITGASSGIGWATALAFAREGSHVVLAARREPELSDLAREIESFGGRALVVPTDVSDPAQIDQLVSKTLAEWGQIDIVVANAGQYIRAPFVEVTAGDLERSLEVNYFGSVNLVLAALPHMLERRSGHIVLMVSLDGKISLPLDAPYVSAKHALVGFGGVARQELRPHGISVSTILPGRVDTAFVDGIRFHPISKPVRPEKVAKAVVRAVTRNKPEVVVPPFIKLLVWSNTLSPRLSDWGTRFFKLEGWKRS